MRKAAAISDLYALQVSESGMELAQREALCNVVISREIVESGKLHDTKYRVNGLRQTKVNIPRLDVDKEFGASGSELQKYYVGVSWELTRKLKKLIGVDSDKTDKTSLNFKIDGEEFSVALRMSGTNRIWSFEKKDLARVASAFNLQLKDTNISLLDCNTEFGASGSELQKYYVCTPSKLAHKINKLIGVGPDKTAKTSLNIKIKDEEFSVVLKKNGVMRIWAFDNKDLSRLASALNLQLKAINIAPLNSNTEFGASANELHNYYVGNRGELAHKIYKLIRVDPDKTDKTSINIKIKDEEFSVVLRTNGVMRIWAFDKKDLARLASALNLQLKHAKISLLNSNTEFGASGRELQKYYVGFPSELARKLNMLIGVDPDKTDKTSLNFKIHGEEFCVALKKNGPRCIWAFEKKDLARLASALNLQLKNKNKPTEISLLNSSTEFGSSGHELQKYYVGAPSELACKIKMLIGVDPEKTDKTRLNFKIGGEEFIIELRLNGTNRIWAFKKKDLARLASALNLELKNTNKPTEIALHDVNAEMGASGPELQKYYVGHPGELARKLNKLIGVNSEKTDKTSLNFKIGGEEFGVALRKNGSRRIWSFKKEDLTRLAKAMNWQLRPQNRPNSGLSRLVQRMTFGSRLKESAATVEV